MASLQEAEETLAVEAQRRGDTAKPATPGRFVGYLVFRREGGKRVEKEFSEMGITDADKRAGWSQVKLYER